MSLFHRLLLVAVLLTAVAAQTSAQTPNEDAKKWTVTGRVINSATRAPVPKANVSAMPQDRNSGIAPISTATAADGSFTLSGEQEALYVITAKRAGFLDGAYDTRRPGRPGTPVQLAPGDKLKDLQVTMTPPAVISGRVFDEDGDPLQHVSVQVLSLQFRSGKRQWLTAGGSRTNDRGEYRVPGLRPGIYVVAASLYNYSPPTDGAAIQRTGYTTLYFPNGREAHEAQSLNVGPGTEMQGIDFHLKKSKVYRISGKVTFPTPTAERHGGFLIISPPRSTARTTHPVSPDGSFEIRNLEPGVYTIAASYNDPNESLLGTTTVEVQDADVRGVTLPLARAFSITGRIAFAGSASKRPRHARIDLKSESTDGVFRGGSIKVNDDGSFALNSVHAGAYPIQLLSIDAPAYLTGAALDGTSVLDSVFNIAGPGTLSLTAATDAATVSGRVNHDNKPFPGATVCLIPTGARVPLISYYQERTSDNTAHFQIIGIAPGEYMLFAFDDAEPHQCHDPEFITPFASKGVRLKASPNGALTLNLDLIQTPR